MSSGVFEARYPGWCICCEDRIHEGEKVKYADDELIHAGCIIYRDDRLPTSTACPKCFQIPATNGECGCDDA